MKKLISVSVLMLIPESMFCVASNLSGKPGPASTVTLKSKSGYKQFNTVTLYGTKYYSGGNNSGQVGYKYYTKLKPSSSQAGNDAISLSLQADG